MSPEAMCKLPHGPASDFFALGIIVYEMMYRRRPYGGPSKQSIRDNILAKQVQIKAHEIPNDWTIECADFINKLIRRKPSSRMGFSEGIQELKEHPWFTGFNWEQLSNRTMPAPWAPPKGDNFKGKNVDF
jgi:serine/threonine protein kinase